MSKKGNILLVANWESDVGYAWWLMENFWKTISDHFCSDHTECHLVYPKLSGIPEAIRQSHIQVTELDMQDMAPANLLRICRFIRLHGIRNVYFSDYPSHCLFYILLRLPGIRIVVNHDHTPGDRTRPAGWKISFKRWIQRIPFYTADHFIAVTDFVHRRHLEVNCIPAAKCSVASNGIVPIDLESAEYDYPYRAFDIPRERQIIVSTGRASYYKGIDFFIECADRLVNHFNEKHLHFLFCGDGPDLDDFRKLSNELGINDYITFAGKRTDIRRILPGCTIGFHAAIGEVGYSLSILEYMSAGLVAVVPDLPSTSAAIHHMKDGILYKAHDIIAATESIIIGLDENTLSIRKHAIKMIEEDYNICNTNKKLTEALASAFS